MKHKTLAAAGALVVIAWSLSAVPALAQGRGHDKVKAKPVHQAKPAKDSKAVKPDRSDKAKEAKPDKDKEANEAVHPVLGSRDRERISDYYAKHSGLPPGLAKRNGDLPPGLEKQLQRNGTLPPGLRKRLSPLPGALERQLDPIPTGFRRGILDRHVVLYRNGTYRIGDSMLNVLR